MRTTTTTLLSLHLANCALLAEPLEHSVFFELKADLAPETASEFKAEALALGEIPDVQNLRWLEEVSSKNPYSFGLHMEFADAAAYRRYLDHPDHLAFVETQWKPRVDDFVEIDYRDEASATGQSIDLLDPELSQWEKWIGVPHATVAGLPEGVVTSENIEKGTPLGHSDPKGTFTTTVGEDGETVLQVSGEIYGGLTSRSEFEDYHLTLQSKWGDQKWEPRLKRKRDSGLLYHCYGEHGAMWKVWKRCLELQIQEGDMGDLFCLVGTRATTMVDDENQWDPQGDASKRGRVRRSTDAERSHGEWNTIELYVLGDQAVHVVNGEVVLALTGAKDHRGEPLTRGQLQLQSEGAECYYRNIRLTPITRLPDAIVEAIR